MLKSMVDSPRPTRAEVSDVANAVYDGTDAVMLSDETTVGKFPIEAVEVLHDTIKDVEKDYPYFKSFDTRNNAEAVSKSAVELAKSLDKESLVAFTLSGMSAQILSKYRPKQSIYAISHSIETQRRLSLVWGVNPLFMMEKIINPSRLIYDFVEKNLKEEYATMDSRFIVTMGAITGKKGSTNFIRLLNREGMEAVLASEF
jgi:pyruvate kinase